MGEDMKGFVICALLALCLGFAAGETFFEEDFSGDWESRWVQSEHKDDLGKFAASAGKFNDGSGSVGLQTSQDAKFYDISAKFENSMPGKLSVFIDDMKRPVLQTKISLLKGTVNGDCHDNDHDRCILDTQGNGYIGFSASTGGERTGVALDANGVTENKHQSTVSASADGSDGIESASLMTGAAQRHEIINMKYCNKMGCVPV